MAEKIKAKAGRHGQALSVWMAALLLFISIFLTAPFLSGRRKQTPGQGACTLQPPMRRIPAGPVRRRTDRYPAWLSASIEQQIW